METEDIIEEGEQGNPKLLPAWQRPLSPEQRRKENELHKIMEEAETSNKLLEEHFIVERRMGKARRGRMLSGCHQFLHLPVQCSSLTYEETELLEHLR